jgi:hypothetical protein
MRAIMRSDSAHPRTVCEREVVGAIGGGHGLIDPSQIDPNASDTIPIIPIVTWIRSGINDSEIAMTPKQANTNEIECFARSVGSSP